MTGEKVMTEPSVPKLECDCWEGGALILDGQVVSPEEAEAAAVTVACMRRGWLIKAPIRGINAERWSVIIQRGKLHGRKYNGNTPREAWIAAMEASHE